MRTHVEFRSDKFPAYPGEEEKINPNRWGQRLAEFLQVKLKEIGIETGEEIGFEDWGCKITLAGAPFPMWIGCGNYEEHVDGYLCFIEPSKPFVWKFPFRKIDTTVEVARIVDAVNKVLNSDPAIHHLRWWAEDEK